MWHNQRPDSAEGAAAKVDSRGMFTRDSEKGMEQCSDGTSNTIAGNWIGQRTLTRMPEKLFRRIFQVLLTLLALRLLVGAALDAGWLDGIV